MPIKIWRLLKCAIPIVVVGIGYLAFFVHENWVTFVFVKRLVTSGDPEAPVRELAALVKVLPRESNNVLISIPGKMGTTWVGHIVHQLLTKGDEPEQSFQDSALIRNLMYDSPYPEFAEALFGEKLSTMKNPAYWDRAPFGKFSNLSDSSSVASLDGTSLKTTVTVRTHVPYANLQKMHATEESNFKLITCFRDMQATLLSSHRFVTSLVGIDSKKVPISHFAWLLRAAGELHVFHQNVVDFWRRRHHPAVLLLFFEDLKESETELKRNVWRIARHLEISLSGNSSESNVDDSEPAGNAFSFSDDVITKVTDQSTLAWMGHPTRAPRFDVPHEVRAKIMEAAGLTEADMHDDAAESDSKSTSVPIVRKKGKHQDNGLPDPIKKMLQDVWTEVVFPATNCTSIEDMRQKMKAERKELRH